MMPMGMMFRLGNVDIAPTIEFVRQYPDQFILGEDPAMGKTPAELMEAVSKFEDIPIITGFWDLIREKQASGEFPQNRKRLLIYITPFAGVVQINAAAAVGRDGTNPGDLTAAENEARQTVQQLVQFFRNHVPGFSDCFLVDTASAIGVRETRRVIGEYTLTMDDVLKAREFDDTIGLGAYCIDIHESDGGITHYHIEDGQAYRTPYRCLVPRDVDGLLMAGRSISVEREAMGATREQVACMVQGEAAGLAAALCAQQGVEPRHLDVGQLRDALTQRGVPL